MNVMPAKRAFIKYILALLLFGSNGIVANRIGLPSYDIVFLRTLMGSAFLAGLFLANKGKFSFFKRKREAAFIAVSGAAMGMSWMFLYEAYAQIGVGLSSLLYYCGPVIVMALSPLLFRERLSRTKLLGFAAVMAGVCFVNGRVMGGGQSLWGILCGAMSAVMYAFMVICNKKAEHIVGLENPLLQLVFSFLTVAVFVLAKKGLSMDVAAVDWLWILLLGLVNTGLGCYFYFSSIGDLPVQTVAICGYLEPLSAVLLSVLILKETMLPVQVLGAVLIIGGAVFGSAAKEK